MELKNKFILENDCEGHSSQNKDWIEHSFVSGTKRLKPVVRIASGLPIWLLKKSYLLDSIFTIAAPLFNLVLIIHNIQTIVKENAGPGGI